MKIIKPTTFQQSMLVSTTATEAHPTWSNATTYNLDDIVIYLNRKYQSVQNSNTGHEPAGTNPDAWWNDIGPSNAYACFDNSVSTPTTAESILTIELDTGIMDSIAFINLDADVVSVVIRDGELGPIIYEYTAGLSGSTVSDWYQYFYFDPLLKRSQLVLFNIPPSANARVEIEFTKAGESSILSIGEIIFGSIAEIGLTQYGLTSGIIDYSRKETDEFGTTTFVVRPFSKRMNAQVMVKNLQLNRVYQLLASIRATPVVWIASTDPLLEEATVVYGFYRDFSIEIAYPSHSNCSLEVEGLT